MLALTLLVASAAFAQESLPAAESLLPAPGAVADGAQRAAEPGLVEAARRDVVRLGQTGDAAWAAMSGSLRTEQHERSVVARARLALAGAPASAAPLRWAVWGAIADEEARDGAVTRIEALLADITDAAAATYVLQPDGGDATTWRIGVQIYGDDAVRRRWAQIDASEEGLDQAVPIWRAAAARDLSRWADDAARPIERDLIMERVSASPDYERIRALHAELRALATAKTLISARRLDAGDAAHAVVIRTTWPGATERVQVLAQVRVGRAVFDVSCETGEGAGREDDAGIDARVERILNALAKRAAPFASRAR